MKNLALTTKEKRIVIILMAINCFALFVNVFAISPVFTNAKGYKTIFILNKKRTFVNIRSGEEDRIDGEERAKDDSDCWASVYHYGDNHYSSIMKSRFYPFVPFTFESKGCGFVFNGIFPYYDYTEFIAYTLLIFTTVLMKKLW